MTDRRCTNCGHKGHFHKDCSEPKTSIGIILFRHLETSGAIEFLLIRRKFTYAYTDFIRGNYSDDMLPQLLSHIIPTEREHILKTKDVRQFWNEIWTSSDYITEKFRRDYQLAVHKFNQLAPQLEDLFAQYPPVTNDPRWEFPKGKRESGESDLKCACREFYEETDIDTGEYEIKFQLSPVVDSFTGNNQIDYKYIYFVGQCHNQNLEPRINPENKYQVHEISNINWFTWDQVQKKVPGLGPEIEKTYEKIKKKYSFDFGNN